MPDKVDSNAVGLRYAIESTIGVLPGSPVWHPLEPNSYNDFGGNFKTIARNPINASRQRRKGALTDVEASGAFEMDFLQDAMYRIMPSFFFAAWRKKQNDEPTDVTSTGYVVADETDYAVGDLIFAAGFDDSGNNGLKRLTAIVTGSDPEISCSGLTADASPATGANVKKVGFQFTTGDAEIEVTGSVCKLISNTKALTAFGLIPGEWIFIGGDETAEKFATAANNGFARVESVATNVIVLDRYPGTMVTDAGTGKTIRIYYADVIKNENDPDLIVRQTIQMERDFGAVGAEYLIGQVGSEFSIDIKSGEDSKVTCSMSFMGLTADDEASPKSGDRPDLSSEPAFTASNDFSRLRLLREDTDASLATYVETLKLSIKNNCSYNKAIGTLGAWEITVGDFEVMGEAEAFFGSFAAAQAIRDNVDASLDFVMAQLNKGWLFDMPLVTLGDARLKVTKDQSVKLPLSANAVAHATLNHTLLAQSFAYLPTAAM